MLTNQVGYSKSEVIKESTLSEAFLFIKIGNQFNYF